MSLAAADLCDTHTAVATEEMRVEEEPGSKEDQDSMDGIPCGIRLNGEG